MKLDIKPGQMWTWVFAVGDGTWFFEKVSESRRIQFMTGELQTVRRGETFTVINTDDEGPAQIPGEMSVFTEFGFPSPVPPVKRWHVVLCEGTLLWVDHDAFAFAELMGNT